MTDKLEMEILWCDNELTELRVDCFSSAVSASTHIYVSDQLVADLIKQINLFLSGKRTECIWMNEEKGDNTTACLSLRFINADKCGHIFIEVYMEIDDGGRYSDHHCCFYITTELGLLTAFCNDLELLRTKIPGIKVTLNK